MTSLREKAERNVAREFTNRLLAWWSSNKRDFSWRHSSSSYEILIAEVLLRRTNAAAVEKVYKEFLSKYPTLFDFASAKPRDIKQLVQGLGLHWRAENIVSLSADLKKIGKIPNSLSDLLKLPGVGPYVARAVLVNSQQVDTVPIDTNVVRVICRYLGMAKRDSFRRHKKFQVLTESMMATENSREFNFALLDLAAAICRPLSPKCSICPLSSECVTGNRNMSQSI